jgi:hypothetical protein
MGWHWFWSALDGAGFVSAGAERNEVSGEYFEQSPMEPACVALGSGQSHCLIEAACGIDGAFETNACAAYLVGACGLGDQASHEVVGD